MRKTPEHWLPKRLAELGKNPAGLARVLGLGRQKVYRIYKPEPRTGKTRRIKDHEIEPMARFLEWTADELLAHQSGRQYAKHVVEISKIADQEDVATVRKRTVIFRATRAMWGEREGYVLSGDIAAPLLAAIVGLGKAESVLSFRVIDRKLEPVYRLRDELIIEPDSEFIVDEDCIFPSSNWTTSGGLVIIARLRREEPDSWICEPVTGGEEFLVPKAEFPRAWAITDRRRPRNGT